MVFISLIFSFVYLFVDSISCERKFIKNTTIADLHRVMNRINDDLNKYKVDDHIERCKWASTRSMRSTFTDDKSIPGGTGNSYDDMMHHAVLIQSICFGDGNFLFLLMYYANMIIYYLFKIHSGTV